MGSTPSLGCGDRAGDGRWGAADITRIGIELVRSDGGSSSLESRRWLHEGVHQSDAEVAFSVATNWICQCSIVCKARRMEGRRR